MSNKKSKSDLIFEALKKNESRGNKADLGSEQLLNFTNLDIDSIKPKKTQVEYASVKIKVELFERIKLIAESYGIKQPGKFISLILESYLKQAEGDEND